MRRLLVLLLAAWTTSMLYLSRHAMLDDALIHLRYAEMLRMHHRITFDGRHTNYGASSLLYVGVLAVLRTISQSPLLPKVVSVVGYLGLLGGVGSLWRRWRETAAEIWTLLLLLTLASPFGMRWLSDGMETVWVGLAAVLLALIIHRSASPAAFLFAGFVIVLLRVDLALLIFFGAAMLGLRREWRRSLTFVAGALLALASILVMMGHILPDTALAKQGLRPLGVLVSTAHVILATYSFGIGLIVVWVGSAVAQRGRDRTTLIVANLIFPVLVVAAAARGQQMQGIRYVCWALLFSITWNLCELAERKTATWRWQYAVPIIFAVAWVGETPAAMRVFHGRSVALEAFQRSSLPLLHDQEILAADVGFLGYFSQAQICDLDGLVDGRDFARLTMEERTSTCLSHQPSVLFLSDAQTGILDYEYGLDSREKWWHCGTVDFTNAGSIDRHELRARRSTYPQGCPAHL